ncbi:MAG: protein phosphatase 2C domain-containing protein, partial [Alphaproteobacteria bacterium]
MEEKLSEPEFGLGDDFAVELISRVRDRLYRDAERAGMKARDFACTFIGLVSTDQGSVVMQVGDGAAVVDAGAGLELAIVPAMGEYANMTYFVTEEDALQKLVTRIYPGAVSRAALFSDGLQRLAL